MQLWEIMVPCVSNDGKPFRTRHHREWDRQVREITGGLTILRPAIGQWVAPDGTLFKERMIPVRIMCTEEQIVNIAQRVLRHYNQLAVFFYLVSIDCRVLER